MLRVTARLENGATWLEMITKTSETNVSDIELFKIKNIEIGSVEKILLPKLNFKISWHFGDFRYLKSGILASQILGDENLNFWKFSKISNFAQSQLFFYWTDLNIFYFLKISMSETFISVLFVTIYSDCTTIQSSPTSRFFWKITFSGMHMHTLERKGLKPDWNLWTLSFWDFQYTCTRNPEFSI